MLTNPIGRFFQGMTYDHFEFHFYLNGKNMETPITGIRGTIFPVFYGMSMILCN